MISKAVLQLLSFVREARMWLILFELVEPATLWKPLYKTEKITAPFVWQTTHKHTVWSKVLQKASLLFNYILKEKNHLSQVFMTYKIQVWFQSMQYRNQDYIISLQIGLIWPSGQPISFYGALCDKAGDLQDSH